MATSSESLLNTVVSVSASRKKSVIDFRSAGTLRLGHQIFDQPGCTYGLETSTAVVERNHAGKQFGIGLKLWLCAPT